MMSRSRRRHEAFGLPALARLLVAVCAAMTLLIGGVGQSMAVFAQDGTPEASPPAGPCDAPALPPGTPTPQMQGSPVAAPAGTEEAEAPAASPEAGTPADEATTKAAVAAVENLVNCLNGGNYEGVAALFTPNMVMQIAGTTNPYDVLPSLQGLAFRDFQTSTVETYADGRLTVEVTYRETEYQYVHERWWLVQDGEYWKLDGFDTLTPEPEGDTAVVGVALGAADNEFSLVPDTDSATQSPVLIFHATNGGKVAHMLAVLKLPEGMTMDQVMKDESLQSQVEFIGSVDYVAPGESMDLALINLPAGEYTLTCFFTAPDGKTHAEHGMVATFTVNAPAA
jgi:uncharacterized cupredoxin-like copper-binding protein